VYISSVRYSVNRKREYQIKTIIFEKESVKYVSKEPYTIQATQHIQKIYQNFDVLKDSAFNIIEPKWEQNKIIFPFIEGENFASLLIKEVLEGNIDNFKEKLLWYKSILTNENQIKFYETEEFNLIFGDGSLLVGDNSLKVPNIDLNFENLIIGNDNTLTVLDYEWVFKFPIPVKYILYRVIRLFINKYYFYLENFITIDCIYSLLEIDKGKIDVYEKMEQSFMDYVGVEWSVLKNNYYKNKITVEELLGNHNSGLALSEQEESIQVFWDINNDFSEAASTSRKIKKEQIFNVVEIDLPTNSIKNLRIDPGSLTAYVEININLFYQEQQINLLNNITSSSGLICLDKSHAALIKFVNITNDPQLILEGLYLEEGEKKLQIEILFTNEEEVIINKLLEKLNENEETKGKLLEENNALKINNQELDIIKAQMQKITSIYEETISTKGWKLLNLVRKFNIFRK